ncbi:nuclear transport factor 2 family protein [Cyanobacteria bacterium FACHB-472]|nr:nuclear transport factor 2 family protein [Cyanobacteria bacterium FACHB-472]
MPNSITLSNNFRLSMVKQKLKIFAFILFTLSVLHPATVRAASPETAPAELKNALGQIDAAANRQDVKTVMQFYSQNFTHSDGLNRQSMEKSLSQIWKRYPKLNYQTQLTSWEAKGDEIVAETVTTITGTGKVDGKDTKIESTVRSRQRFQNQKIVQQEILAERTQMTTGAKPPTVNMKLPEQVRVGQSYNLDAVVQEPLGDDLMLGAAVEEPVKAERFVKPAPVDLELLSSGGIFKVGRAPLSQGNYWVSTVLIREEGTTMVTQRLRVVEGNAGTK